MQKLFNTITVLIVIYLLLGVSNSGLVGGVRSRTTGFYLNQGENIAIGTSTPTLADIHIYKTATSTLSLDGGMGCLIVRDKSTDGLVFYISDNQDWATTTAADCGF